ncbi:MAG: type III PLP-dependent enzyme [Rhodospirillales bacterium]|nr:type III PLP-dependent enzyme [Rhodospirillales bacterium]
MSKKVAAFLNDRRPPTPFLVLDLGIVESNFKALRKAMPDSRIYYAVKANPAPEILTLLARQGACFDAASVPEIEMALAAGAGPERISYGNTIKKEVDIARAYELGVRMFAFDSAAELDKLSQAAPASRVFCRILTSNEGADWPLSRKFGCDPAMAYELLRIAPSKGVVPYGLSFHVGSQQRDPKQWDNALKTTAELFQRLKVDGVQLQMVNLGGGFPTRYRQEVPSPRVYARTIHKALLTHFGNSIPDTVIEPGRALVGSAGVIHSEVVLISKKSATDEKRWVFLDIGKFGGLAETMDEAIQYPIVSARNGRPEPVILAGPTCDSMDVLYERADYRLPNDLKVGDRLEIRATGAYTTTYASVAFNGFQPLAAYYI